MAIYYPEECIFDLIAASGAQSGYAVALECSTQCNTLEFDERNTIGEHHAAATRALRALESAGIIVFDLIDKAYDLTEFGYQLTNERMTKALRGAF